MRSKKLRASEIQPSRAFWYRLEVFVLSLSLSIVSRIFSVPLRLVCNGLDLHAVLGTRSHQAVAWDEMPVVLLISARLTRDDDVLPVIFDSFSDEAICRRCSVGIVWVFSVQGGAGDCGVVSVACTVSSVILGNHNLVLTMKAALA